VPDALNANALALIARPVLATLCTVDTAGAPQATPLWVEADGGDIVVNTAQGRAKARYIDGDRRVAVTVVDPDNQYNVVALRGEVVEVTTEGADAQIDRLAKKYLDVDAYPMRQDGEVRISVRIRPERILMQPS
jgi:PPOX class probable F420-dependent enzyme